MRTKLIAALTLSAALAVAAPTTSRATPDQTQGMATMSAHIAQTGAILGGVGVVDAVWNGTGVYTIEFVRDLTGCAPTATALNDYVVGILGVSGNKVGIGVYHLSDGEFADRAYYLTISCTR